MPRKAKMLVDERQIKFIEYLLGNESDTKGCVLQSAIKAGFSSSYGSEITARMPQWLEGAIDKKDLVAKAERNLDIFLSDDFIDDNKVKADMTKFTLSRLARDTYSEKIITDGSGNKIELVITDYKRETPKDKSIKILAD